MTTIDLFCTRFREQFFDADEIEITPETDFRMFGTWDSLTGMAVLVMLKENYGVDLSVEEFKSCDKVVDVYELTKSKMQ